MNLYNQPNTAAVHTPVNIETHNTNPIEALRRHGQTQQDIVRLLDQIILECELQKKTLLPKALPGWEFSSAFYTNGPFSYAAEDCTRLEPRQLFLDSGEPYGTAKIQAFYQAGTWNNSYTGANGVGIISLLAHILGASLMDAVIWIATVLAIDLGKLNSQQASVPTNYDFIARPEVVGIFVMPEHWLLGPPSRNYCFTTEFNSQSFHLKEWVVSNETIRLFSTFCRNRKTGEFSWLFTQPPIEEILFNRQRLFHERDLPVHIFDDIALAAQHASHPDFVATWSGEVDFTANIDWSLLAGREVTYASPLVTQNSFIIGETLHNTLNEMQTNLTLEKIDEAYCA